MYFLAPIKPNPQLLTINTNVIELVYWGFQSSLYVGDLIFHFGLRVALGGKDDSYYQENPPPFYTSPIPASGPNKA